MKHLLDTRELTREEAIEILDVADYMAQVKAENRTLNVLNGKTVVNPVSYTHLTLPTTPYV